VPLRWSPLESGEEAQKRVREADGMSPEMVKTW
jgi:hypothetical protein